jgi:superfamily II DNA or RNA helicase
MINLLPCQSKAADDFVAKSGRAYLDSAVGSGKTFFVAECFRRSMSKYPAPCLYLATKTSLKSQVSELTKYGLKAVAVDLSADKRLELWKNTQQGVVYAMTLEAIGCPEREWNALRHVPWGMIAIDEADRLTAGASKRNRRLLALTGVRHRLMMTGTPLKNGLKDSYFPIMWLSCNPPWRNWTDFKNRELLFQNPNCPKQITGIRDENYLASLMSDLMIRMVNPDAPKELEVEEVLVEMNEEQRKAYDALKEDLILEVKSGTLTVSNSAVLNLRLRQFLAMPEALGHSAHSSKEKKLLEMLAVLKGKTAVFTSFATVAEILGKRYGWPIVQGSVSAKKRQAIVDSKPDILVMTSAGERGINCPWLTNVISLDRGFTPAVLRQRAGRATRYGRTGEARLFLLTCPNTVDVLSEARIVNSKLKQARKCQPKPLL